MVWTLETSSLLTSQLRPVQRTHYKTISFEQVEQRNLLILLECRLLLCTFRVVNTCLSKKNKCWAPFQTLFKLLSSFPSSLLTQPPNVGWRQPPEYTEHETSPLKFHAKSNSQIALTLRVFLVVYNVSGYRNSAKKLKKEVPQVGVARAVPGKGDKHVTSYGNQSMLHHE